MLPGVPTFKDKLDWLAEQRDWSINQIAKKADVPQSTLHKALNGQMIRVDAAIRLAQTMDVSVEWLFDNRYDLKDLPKRPFWLPPNLDPATGVILEGLQKGLGPLTLLFIAIFYGGDVCRTLVANGAIPLIPGLWLVPGLMLMGLLMLVARDFSLLQKFSR